MKKRIVVCCDGTWQNSDNGYVKPSSSHPIPTLQVPSNVTRISRAFKRNCSDGSFQIVYYQSGVGSRSGIIDRILGGAFGIGIAENIREAYAYICANYVDGDEIVLIGFSRGAFTARSIGGMISDLGLLTREGMEFFYPVFKDMQNWMNTEYKDQFPKIPFPDKPKGPHAAEEYRKKLVEVYGILLSNKIEHGFHALALDETRGPFSPTLWERQPENRDTSDLRQVWFPGSHGNVGGGWQDQGVANITLAWMMDQLSSIGCEFVHDAIERLHDHNVKYYHSIKPKKTKREKCAKCCGTCCCGARTKEPLLWAAKPIFDANKPVRPWSLHSIRSVSSPLYGLVGSVTRSPGMYKKIDPENGRHLRVFLKDTNERIHSSVRTRLACEGLGLNDSKVWECPALLQVWRPCRVAETFPDPVPQDAAWGPQGDGRSTRALTDITNTTAGSIGVGGGTPDAATQEGNPPGGQRWVWEYIGPDMNAPYDRKLVEETLGPWENHLLALSTNKGQVRHYAEVHELSKLKVFNTRKHERRSKKSKKSKKSKAPKSPKN
ncbi:hypothetical protein F4804DRAFT_350818 [Jackrogersella minutella]|nr:hypothetical protein F4804DRAFT_350818 [Jackrogersella minutella]